MALGKGGKEEGKKGLNYWGDNQRDWTGSFQCSVLVKSRLIIDEACRTPAPPARGRLQWHCPLRQNKKRGLTFQGPLGLGHSLSGKGIILR